MVMAQAEKAGARIVKRETHPFWGGSASYFQDPDPLGGPLESTIPSRELIEAPNLLHSTGARPADNRRTRPPQIPMTC
jgi:hypothetical protein